MTTSHRKLIVAQIMSLDGYVAGPGNNVMALPMDGAFDRKNVEHLRAASTLLLGRVTFQMFEGFWPSMADNPAASADNREIARLDNAIDKMVVSDSLTPARLGAWRSTTTIVTRARAHDAVRALKSDGRDGDIVVFGSRTLANDLMAAGLVDELSLLIGPVVLGGGLSAFDEKAAAPLRLVEARRCEGSDNVLLRYATTAD